MSLAGVDQLQRADVVSYVLQPIHVCKEEIGSLVGSGAPGEP